MKAWERVLWPLVSLEADGLSLLALGHFLYPGSGAKFTEPGAKVPMFSEKHRLSRGPDLCGHDQCILFLRLMSMEGKSGPSVRLAWNQNRVASWTEQLLQR